MAQCPLGGRMPLFDGWGRHTQKQGAEEGELVRPPLAAGGPALWSAPALPRPGAGTGALARPGRCALGIGPERNALTGPHTLQAGLSPASSPRSAHL